MEKGDSGEVATIAREPKGGGASISREVLRQVVVCQMGLACHIAYVDVSTAVVEEE